MSKPAPGFDPSWKLELTPRSPSIPGFGGGPDGPKEPDEPQQLRWMVANSGRENVRYLVWEFDCTREEMLAQVERWRSGEERARRVTVADGSRLSATATAASLRGWAQSAERARPRAILAVAATGKDHQRDRRSRRDFR